MCKYCESDKNILYQTNVYANLYLLQKVRSIKIETTQYLLPLTKHEIKIRNIQFAINFCPECGRDLRKEIK